MDSEDEAPAKELAEDEARAADEFTVRTMKEAKKLMGKPDLIERAAAAHQRVLDCRDHARRLVANCKTTEPSPDVIDTMCYLMSLGEKEFVIYCAMSDDEQKRWYAAGRRFYEENPLAQKPFTVSELMDADYD